MDDAAAQVCGGLALDDHGVETQARHLNFAKRVAVGRRMWIGGRYGLVEFAKLHGFVDMRIRKDKTGVTEGDNSQRQKEITGAAEDFPSWGRRVGDWRERR